MKKVILITGALLLVVLMFPKANVWAGDDGGLKIERADLYHVIGRYDPAHETFSNLIVVPWDTVDPMGFHKAIARLPDSTSTFFGLAPWFAEMTNPVRQVRQKNLIYAIMVDVKRSHTADPVMTKWRVEGDSLELVCATKSFIDKKAAPSLQGFYVFPDSTVCFLMESSGGDLSRLWHDYQFIMEDSDCDWSEFYTLNSVTEPGADSYTEISCEVLESTAPEFVTIVVEKHFGSVTDEGEPKRDVLVRTDSSFVSLWKLAQAFRKTGKKVEP